MTSWLTPHAIACVAACALLTLGGCAVLGDPHAYYGDKYLDTDVASTLGTAGVESNDLQAAASSAVQRILAEPALTNGARFRVEAADFAYEATGEAHHEALADLVRNELINAADGRVTVVTPRFGHGTDATGGMTPIEADYALAARVTDVVDSDGAREDRYTQILFEVVDLNDHEIVMSDMYYFKKASNARRQWKYAN